MTIPASLRVPGPKSEISFVENPNAVSIVNNAIVIVAEKSSAGTATAETPVAITNAVDADTLAGVGSLAALMARASLKVAAMKGQQPSLYLCPIAEPGAGTAAVQTLTVTAVSVTAGNLVVKIAGRTLTVGVSSSDTANTIATALKNAIDALKTTLPVTASVATNVVTCTFVTKGVNGNDCKYEVVSTPNGVSVASAQATPGAGVTDISNALSALYDRRYHGIALANHATTDVADVLLDEAVAWAPGTESFRFYTMAETGSIGTAQTLQAAANSKALIIASCEQSATLPGEIAAMVATAWLGYEKPTINMDGVDLPIDKPSGAYAYTPAEQESLLASGVTPIAPQGNLMTIVRLVTSKTTENSAPFEPTREPAYVRMGAVLAEQLSNDFRTQFKQETLTPEIERRVRASVIARHRSYEAIGWLRDVDQFVSRITVAVDPSASGRLLVTDPFRVAGPLHQVYYNHIMFM